MMPFYLGIKDNLDARCIFTDETRVKIKFRERIHEVLDELPCTCDKFTVDAYRKGDTMDSVLVKFRVSMDEALAGFVDRFPDSTNEQLDWINDRLDRLIKKLEERGDKHIKDLDYKRHRHQLEEEGGDGYTIRYLGKNWSIYNYAYSSLTQFKNCKIEF